MVESDLGNSTSRKSSNDEKESFDVRSMHIFNIEKASLQRYSKANIIQHYPLKLKGHENSVSCSKVKIQVSFKKLE